MLTKSFKVMITTSIIFLSNNAFSQENAPKFPIGNITGLNANYVTPKGDGSAKLINIEGFGNFTNAKLEVENYGGTLMFQVQDKAFELDLSALQIQDADKIGLTNLNYRNDNSEYKLGLSGASAIGEGFKTNLSGLSWTCSKGSNAEDEVDQLLKNCFNKMNLRLSKAYFKDSSSSFYNISDESQVLGDAMTIEGIKLDINGEKFKGELKGNISKGVKVKFEGRTTYDVDNRVIHIRVDKAKAGFINVKKTIFKELEKMESNNIEVDYPNVYIILQEIDL